jgi:hypothetical protein
LANIHVSSGIAGDAGGQATVISSKIAPAPQNDRFAIASSNSCWIRLHSRFERSIDSANGQAASARSRNYFAFDKL